MSSRNAGSGIGSRAAASASAMSTGSVGGTADRLDLAAGIVEQSKFLGGGQGAVADVIDAPRVRIDRGKRAALFGANNPDAVLEIFAAARMMRSHSS